jgi:peptidoglycan/LPS O-acetylase OafA/YrhL
MPEEKSVPRIVGLDTLRAVAIALVLVYHHAVVIPGPSSLGVLSQIGWSGVDLFFVLSGYLIGNQILGAFARGERFSPGTFFARRLLRTLPNYYAVLAVYWLLPSLLAGSDTAPLWRFLTFTQNLDLKYGQTFTHSWSLCIEEQFYVILPFAVMAIAGFRRSVRLGWMVLAAAILAGMTARGLAWANSGHTAFNQEVYYSSFTRLDELLPGVAIAMLKNFHREHYERLLRHWNGLLVAGAASVAVLLIGFNTDAVASGFVLTSLGFSLLSMGFALLTLAALSPDSLLNRLRVPGAGSLALWSYAIYLAHKPIYKMMIEPLDRMGLDPHGAVGVAIVMAAGVLGGWVLHKAVETPFMQLRERHFPAQRFSRTAM